MRLRELFGGYLKISCYLKKSGQQTFILLLDCSFISSTVAQFDMIKAMWKKLKYALEHWKLVVMQTNEMRQTCLYVQCAVHDQQAKKFRQNKN